jgi:hypothetical protein
MEETFGVEEPLGRGVEWPLTMGCCCCGPWVEGCPRPWTGPSNATHHNNVDPTHFDQQPGYILPGSLVRSESFVP